MAIDEHVESLARLLYALDGGLASLRREDREDWTHPSSPKRADRYRDNARVILRDYQPRER